MARNDQPDLFATGAQADLFGEDAAAPEYRPNPDQVRARLHKILAEARAAQTFPWAAICPHHHQRRPLLGCQMLVVGSHRNTLPERCCTWLLSRPTNFPQMTLWLPEDEGAQLRFEFETEVARLEAA
jgi:hypothetical protein